MEATVVRPERCLEEISHWMSAYRHRVNADKTELGLLWAGSKYSQLSLGSKGLPLQIDSDTVTASDHVRVLGIIFSADLSLEKHVSSIRASCFFWLGPTSASSTITGRRVREDTCPRFCDSSSRLL